MFFEFFPERFADFSVLVLNPLQAVFIFPHHDLRIGNYLLFYLYYLEKRTFVYANKFLIAIKFCK